MLDKRLETMMLSADKKIASSTLSKPEKRKALSELMLNTEALRILTEVSSIFDGILPFHNSLHSLGVAKFSALISKDLKSLREMNGEASLQHLFLLAGAGHDLQMTYEKHSRTTEIDPISGNERTVIKENKKRKAGMEKDRSEGASFFEKRAIKSGHEQILTSFYDPFLLGFAFARPWLEF